MATGLLRSRNLWSNYVLCGYKFAVRRFSDNSLKIAKSSKKWQSVIGIEVHAQIASESKLFSASGTEFAELINNQVSFFDASLPGTLPVLNRRCVEAAIQTAFALNCRVNLVSKFDRKHYFYADLPTGYQITQQRLPIAVDGEVEYNLVTSPGKDPVKKRVIIKQIQLEQDSGKSIHDEDENKSLIDLNRAGVGLMEIVTDPVFNHGEEVSAFIKELQLVLKCIGACDGKMEEGSLRVDANISINQPGKPLGTRTEVKNINSVRNINKAINYEIKRQIDELEAGNEIVNQTRSFDSELGITVAMRDKERVQDYRFLPEPNLPPLRVYNHQTMTEDLRNINAINIDKLKETLPELPEAKRQNLMNKYGITRHQVVVLMGEDGLLEYFEEILNADKDHCDPKLLANWLTMNLLTELHKLDWTLSQNTISSENFGKLVNLVQKQSITVTIGKMVLAELLSNPHQTPNEIIASKNWSKLTDTQQIEKRIEQILAENTKAVTDFKKGKTKAFNFLIGQAQKATEFRADPQYVIKVLKDKLQT
ncbi:glutamyl-tRNA(Gln) amidotransferase subunit B, mitochondrial-like [Tubulanus polymorphus]|uniref:glutamyl-tRNA(Gln) amidotransferase subunit B, mitochondrial-like n=1 Tax=Tubulanus polymorphus TaxID=672921 RepID=UPI003DA1E172